MNKFRLVVFGSDWDVYQTAFRDFAENPRITYIPTCRPAGGLGLLQRVQFNPKLNHLVNIPYKHLWNPYYLRDIQNTQQLCFLVLENWLRLECGIRLLPYLRNTYPDARIVCFMQDLADTIIDHYSHRPVDLEYVRKYADLLVSYDAADAKKHGMHYHPTVFSPVDLGNTPLPSPCDLYFLGRDKGRLHLLVEICKEAQRKGIKAKFILMEVPPRQRIECDGITYQDQPVPYMENLRNVTASKCVIEMLQPGADSPTFRTWEAIALNKKLLTTNSSIQQYDIYDKQYISVFHNIADINWLFIEDKWLIYESENPYLQTIRPASLIKYIEKQLNILIDR